MNSAPTSQREKTVTIITRINASLGNNRLSL